MSSDSPPPKIPNLTLAQSLFTIRSQPSSSSSYSTARDHLLSEIEANSLAPLYLLLKDDLPDWSQSTYDQLKTKNDEEETKLDEKLKEAEEMNGESEVSEALIAKFMFLAKILDKDRALTAHRVAMEKTPTLGHKIDLVFTVIRLGLFFSDADLIARNVEKAQWLIDSGGDWDRRNRLKAYHGIYLLSIRSFAPAADLLLDVLSTFTSTELMEFEEVVMYAVLAGSISLSRVDLKTKVIDSPEVLQILPSHGTLEPLNRLINSLYIREYATYFQALAEVEQILKKDRYLASHARVYVREMRRKAYAQLLESYRSLSIDYMAEQFGVTREFIDAYAYWKGLTDDSDLSRFIPSKKLNCVIDRVNGTVETNRPDNKNAQYQKLVKEGDLLLNKLQKYQAVVRLTGADA